jgi:hypothetical protein
MISSQKLRPLVHEIGRRWQYGTVHKTFALFAELLKVRRQCKHTLIIFNTYCFSTSTVVTRTLLNVTFYVHCFMAWWLATVSVIFLWANSVKSSSVLCRCSGHYWFETVEGIFGLAKLAIEFWGARGDAVGWDTALQAGLRWFRLPIMSLEFFMNVILPEVDSASNRINMMNISWSVKAASAWADKLTAFMCQLSWNVAVSNSWNL